MYFTYTGYNWVTTNDATTNNATMRTFTATYTTSNQKPMEEVSYPAPCGIYNKEDDKETNNREIPPI